MASQPIKVGFVGLSTQGWAAAALAPSLFDPEELQGKYKLTAVSTSSPATAAATAEKYSAILGYPVTAYHGDTSRIANDPDVDLVVVSVRAPLHYSAVMPIIEAGKGFFLEWPVGTSIEQTREMAEAARAKNLRTVVSLQGTQSAVLEKIKNIIDSGKIGKVRSTSVVATMSAELGFWGPRLSGDSQYLADASNGGSVFEIAGGHQLIALTEALGDFASVTATSCTQYPCAELHDSNQYPTADLQRKGDRMGKSVRVTAPDHVTFSGILKSGAIASVFWRAAYNKTPGRKQFQWDIDGDEGSIRVESDEIGGSLIQRWDPKLYLNGELIDVPYTTPSLGNLTKAWVEIAKGAAGKYPTMQDALKLRELVHAVMTSAKEGTTVYLH